MRECTTDVVVSWQAIRWHPAHLSRNSLLAGTSVARVQRNHCALQYTVSTGAPERGIRWRKSKGEHGGEEALPVQLTEASEKVPLEPEELAE